MYLDVEGICRGCKENDGQMNDDHAMLEFDVNKNKYNEIFISSSTPR